MNNKDNSNGNDGVEMNTSTGNEGIKINENNEKGIGVVSYTTNTTNTTNTTIFSCSNCSNVVIHQHTLPKKTLESEIIICLLEHNNEPLTVNKISDVVGKNKSSIRQAIIYGFEKKGIFELKFQKNGENYYSITTAWMEQQIDTINREREFLLLKDNENLYMKSRLDDLTSEAKNFFEFNKKLLGEGARNNGLINLDFNEISEFSSILSEEILSNPEETIKLINSSLSDSVLVNNPKIKIFNVPNSIKKNIEQLRSCNVNSLISITGRVINISDVRPQVVNAKFECPSCGTVMSVLQMEKKFREPPRCSCGRRGGFRLISKEMIDTARLTLEDLQEKTDNPHSKRINCFLKDDLLHYGKMSLYSPGTEVELIGILKEIPVELKNGSISTRFDLAFEVNNVLRANEEITIDKLTDEDIIEIKELAEKININGIDEITSSFAPSIYGYDYIKKAIILQLSSKKNTLGKERTKNKPNILLIGDPGVAKTVIGEFAVDITNGARKSVGGSASAVGFTGAVVRDEYSGGWSLEPGAMVLARDLFLLDELNNIKEEDRPRLQEALSENTITIDKATIHTKLPATAGVLATANPINGLFDENEDITRQFSLPAPIINRFDLIFVLKDNVDKEVDEKIAKRMNEREMKKIKPKYDKQFLKKFFIFIKEQEIPRIDEEISEKMSKVYSELRKFKTSSLNINPRVHLSMLQLCKASAMIRLSEKIEEKDIKVALDLLNKSYFKTPELNSILSPFIE